MKRRKTLTPKPPTPVKAPAKAPIRAVPRQFTKLHLNVATPQLDAIRRVSNQTGISLAYIFRTALQHWLDHHDPGNPLALRCLYPRTIDPSQTLTFSPTRRASAPPANEPDHRIPQARRPWVIPGDETRDGKPLHLPYEQMDRLADLMMEDEKKHPKDNSDDAQARRLARRMQLSVPETLHAMQGIHEGYLGQDDDNEDNSDENEEGEA